MSFDNPTLFKLLLLQALTAAVLMLVLTGRHASAATRRAVGFLGLQAMGWLMLANAEGGAGRLLMSLSMLAFSASLSLLWWALRLWLGPQPGRVLLILAPLLMPLVYALQFEDSTFRVAWAHGWLSLQLALIILNLVAPARQSLTLDRPAKSGPNAPHALDNRRWRALLLCAVVPVGLLSLLRGGMGLLDPQLRSLLMPATINSVLALSLQWALTTTLLGLILAWRGETEQELAHLAQTDGLTGLVDARAFAARTVDMISMARRHREPLALMILDIDHLAAINATHGMEAGNKALALFGSCLQTQMRLGDLAGRIGGEEFGVLMARCESQGPQALDKRMRETLARRAVSELGFELNFSAGWAKLRHGDRHIQDLMRRAETAVYEAKHAGRGQLYAEPGLEI
ncbi:GGDEF domain-containing protein [Roseateles koreensis]|uniref:diguanylate cyclase n=1 Tax=Roseateles koreensis TaxID=2987526 RepID=A0ABT5KSE5_9BURK|nr:GGDEF domain-containing protein [Roseateles koreensis]MDC8784702.1 GGDEF domain-containing protein [Roseateles koreensis]